MRTAAAAVLERLDDSCAARLTPALLPLARPLAAFGEGRLSPAVEAQWGTSSRATVQRRLTGLLPWDTREPGHFEGNLVHHGGASAHGEYVQTRQTVDAATGWRERAAVLGRSQVAMGAAFRRILGGLG